MRWRLTVILITLFLALAIWVGYDLWYAACVLKPDAYAAEWTGHMVAAFVSDHPGRWPRAWFDLRAYSATHYCIQPFLESCGMKRRRERRR